VINNKNASQVFSPSIGIKILADSTRQKIILPFYHAISNENLSHIKHLYPVRNEQTFRKDLDFFLKNYNPIDVHQLQAHIDGKQKIKANSFFLSFDDGLSEIFHMVAPILLEKGIPATFFLNSAFIDNKDLFYRYKASLLIDALKEKQYSDVVLNEVKSHLEQNRSLNLHEQILSVNYNNKFVLDKLAELLEVSYTSFLQNNKPYLTSEQIKTLIKQGFTIGAHSIDHPQYNTISLEEQVTQTKKSVQYIADTFGVTKNIFAFPFTDNGVSIPFFDAIHPYVDLTFGTAGMKKDVVKTNLQRIPMEQNNRSASSIIYNQYAYYLAKFSFGKNTIKRK
jgi:peptidoglycan/xylan/chitin deacetylase (PgdA/CDA1 family)